MMKLTPRGGLRASRSVDPERFETTDYVYKEQIVRERFSKFDVSGLGLNLREALSLVRWHMWIPCLGTRRVPRQMLRLACLPAHPVEVASMVIIGMHCVVSARPLMLTRLACCIGQAEVLWEVHTHPVHSAQQR